MKILFFSPYFFPYTSGLTTYPLKILTHLNKKNDVTVITFPHRNKLKIVRQPADCKLKIIHLPYLFKISKGFISPQSLEYFYKYVINTDLIILNQPNFEGLFLALFGKIFNKKVISIFHCQVFLSPHPWKRVVNFFLDLSMKIQLSLSDKIVAYTKDYFDSLPDMRPFRKKTLFTLPPIESAKPDHVFSKRFGKLKKYDIWIGYSGRIASEKGLEYLIQAVGLLNKRGVKLVLAGPYGKDVAGENNYYQKTKQLLTRQKIRHSFLGNLNDKQLSSFYRAIDVLVLSSVNQTEAFGMVQAEAMISGTPVIASDLPGVRIPVRLTKMGLIVSPKNSKEITQAISKILKSKKQFANEKLTKKAQEIFDIQKVYGFYENLISKKIRKTS
jgi:glycosyltransferase involved in cell wall biosynthesis